MENNESSLWQIYQTVVLTPKVEKISANSLIMLLSVWNADGAKHTRLQNRLLENRVKTHLVNKGLSFSQLWGGSAEMDYRELTIAFEVKSVVQAKCFARFAKQKAFYLVKNNRLYLVNTIGRGKPCKLASLNEHTNRYPLKLLKFGKNQAVAE